MTDKEYLHYLEERINSIINECDHYAKAGVISPEWMIDELYKFTAERERLMRKIKE